MFYKITTKKLRIYCLCYKKLESKIYISTLSDWSVRMMLPITMPSHKQDQIQNQFQCQGKYQNMQVFDPAFYLFCTDMGFSSRNLSQHRLQTMKYNNKQTKISYLFYLIIYILG